MSAQTHRSSSIVRILRAEAEHDEGLATIMRMTDYLGDAKRAAIALVEKHGAKRSLELLDQVIGECGQNDSPHAVEMGAMWMMVRNHITDTLGCGPVPEAGPPARK
jgi:hypothetical protein